MYLWLIGTAISACIVWSLWKTYKHPAQILARQAASMNWAAAGTLKDENGYRNVRLIRGENEAVIWYKAGNVTSLHPKHSPPFKDFIELEKWLSVEGRKNQEGETDLAASEWKNRELAVYFTPQPNDPIWKNVSHLNAELIQSGFLEIWRK